LNKMRDRKCCRGGLLLCEGWADVSRRSDGAGPRRPSGKDQATLTDTSAFKVRSVDGALKTFAAYKAMNMIRKDQIRPLAKGDVLGVTCASSNLYLPSVRDLHPSGRLRWR